jgi:PhoH-like ATPase
LTSKKNLYILDTCVLLHDPNAIYNFQEHDVCLSLSVIDDLDSLKTTPGTIGWSAREVFRTLDKFDIKGLTNGGVKINEMGGKLSIYNPEIPNPEDTPNITRLNSDNAIINASRSLKNKFPRKNPIIVTKDIGLKIRSMSYGCESQNYRSDLLEDGIYTGMRYVDINTNQDWDLLWSAPELQTSSFSKETQEYLKNLSSNECVIFSWGESKCPTIYKHGVLRVLKDKSNGNGKHAFMGIRPANLEQICAMEILSDDSVSLVSICGPAGTGKTLSVLAVSLQQIYDGHYDKLVLIKPIMPVGGKDLGALPGYKYEKLYNWFGPFRDNISILSYKDSRALSFEDLVEENKIEAEAMTYIQGRSLANSIIIIDESSNLSPREARMAVERCGKNSKVILLGDLSQVENPYLDSRSCGLAHSMNGGKGLENCAAITLSKVERSTLAAMASQIFNRPEARN